MILRQLELEAFGRFRNRSFELRRGMNLILGPNESGKSTLAEVIPTVLFGARDSRQFKPWGRNACSAKLLFEGKNRTVEIQRDLLSDEVSLVERDDLYHTLSEFQGRVPLKGRSSVYQEYYALLENLLGVSDEGVFRATCYFGHRPQEWTGNDLSKKLRALFGSGPSEGDYAEIMDQLLEEHFALTCVNPWGRNKQRAREYEEVCEQLNAIEGHLSVQGVSSVLGNDAETSAQIKQLREEVERDKEEYAKGVRYIDRLRTEMRNPENSQTGKLCSPAAKGMSAQLREDLEKAGLPEELPRSLPEMLSEAEQIRQELAQLQQPFAKLDQQEKQAPKVRRSMMLLAFTVLAGAMFLSWWQNLQIKLVGISGGLVLLCLSGWAGWLQAQRKKILAECSSARLRLNQRKEMLMKRQSVLSDQCEALGLPSTAIDLVRLQKLVDKHKAELNKLWREEQGNGQAQEQSSKSSPTSAQVEKDPVKPVSKREMEELELRLKEFGDSLEQREGELKSLENQLQGAKLKTVASNLEETKVSGLVQRKIELENRISTLRTAIELLGEAVEQFVQTDLSAFTVEVSRLFAKVTKNRYRAVRFDSDMKPEIKVDQRRWQPVNCFSRGTIDALYLSLRIALTKVRGDGKTLPLLFDDPFVHLDQTRLMAMLNMIDLAASDSQLILLSHSEYMARRAARERWHVITLDEEQSLDEGEEEQDHAGQLHLL